MKTKWINAYMDVAERFSLLSVAHKLKVGAVVVKDHRIISIGYNGTPSGWDNTCEDFVAGETIYEPDSRSYSEIPEEWVTREEVIHAEANAIAKLARDYESGKDAILFCTHAPCIHCAKLIYGAGIVSVYYRNVYKTDAGVKFLKKCGVEVNNC